MASFFDLFRRGTDTSTNQDAILEDLNMIRETPEVEEVVHELVEDKSDHNGLLMDTDVETIQESVVQKSPESINKMIDANDIKAEQLLSELNATYNLDDTYRENEEMARDSVVGSAMELIANDVAQIQEKYKIMVKVISQDEKLAQFLQDFLEHNINIEDRLWEWALEIIKHGDFKLRRREFYIGMADRGSKDVYYENVLNPYKVARIEYMGRILGFMDNDDDENNPVFESPDTFIHFMNTKLPRREKVKVTLKNKKTNKQEQVTCIRVNGVSLMDNARYIWRITNLLDNMLVMSRVARSTQYNLVKIEVGNASAAKTQQILSDVRRRIEGNTKMKKGSGMKTDPSPIPVNSNIYIPTRDGKGDVTVDSINESVDVESITDIDYFRNKEFATLQVPKSYLGWEEEMPGSMGNNSLVKLDIRYARNVQRAQTILRYGIEDLCNNYLRYRGRKDDIGKFEICMRDVVSAENAGKVEEHITNMQAFDAMSGFMESYSSYIDKPKLLRSTLNLIGWEPSDIGNKEFLDMVKKMEDGTYEGDTAKPEEEETEGY